MALNENIKKYRKKSGFTQKALADKSGLSFSMISKLESGEQTNPSFETLNKISGALKISPEKLVSVSMTIEEQIDEYIKYKRGLINHSSQITGGEKGGQMNRSKVADEPYTDLNFRRKLQAINTIPMPEDDFEAEYLKYLQKRPEVRKLFSSLKNVSKDDVEQVITFLEILQQN